MKLQSPRPRNTALWPSSPDRAPLHNVSITPSLEYSFSANAGLILGSYLTDTLYEMHQAFAGNIHHLDSPLNIHPQSPLDPLFEHFGANLTSPDFKSNYYTTKLLTDFAFMPPPFKALGSGTKLLGRASKQLPRAISTLKTISAKSRIFHSNKAMSSSKTAIQGMKASLKNSGWVLPHKGGAKINGRWYTEHALERMAPKDLLQHKTELISRGVPTSVVENAIIHGNKKAGNSYNEITHIYENIKVVTNSDCSRVITVISTGR